MAFSVVKSVCGVASRLFNHTRPHYVAPAGFRSLLSFQSGQTTRAFARSMWYMSGSSSKCSGSAGEEVKKFGVRVGWPQRCGCCGLHTKGDEELSKYLQEEIKAEKSSHDPLPQIDGFHVTMDGTDGKLTKTQGGETVSVLFNVNHSVEFEASPEESEEDGKMKCYPNFEVQIAKSGKPTLTIQCRFVHGDIEEEEENKEEDLFLIDEVLVHDGEVDDKTYIMGTEVMDGELYEMLMNMLDERGINSDFAEDLSNLASSMEHTLYISFLEQLRTITSS
ncbi:complement component 1 Q subcomponent-binding protein, mitochondrial-like [Glandiceps talaboti]